MEIGRFNSFEPIEEKPKKSLNELQTLQEVNVWLGGNNSLLSLETFRQSPRVDELQSIRSLIGDEFHTDTQSIYRAASTRKIFTNGVVFPGDIDTSNSIVLDPNAIGVLSQNKYSQAMSGIAMAKISESDPRTAYITYLNLTKPHRSLKTCQALLKGFVIEASENGIQTVYANPHGMEITLIEAFRSLGWTSDKFNQEWVKSI